jgi:hypothetical protein
MWWGKRSRLIGAQRYDFAGRAPLTGNLAAGANRVVFWNCVANASSLLRAAENGEIAPKA